MYIISWVIYYLKSKGEIGLYGTLVVSLVVIFVSIRIIMITRKKKQSSKVSNIDTNKYKNKIPVDIFRVIESYMEAINDVAKWKNYVTNNFVKEVYYATTQDRFNPLLSLNRMISVINETSKQRTKVVKYTIDEFIDDPKEICIGVRRYYNNGSTNRVRYTLVRSGSGWLFNHIIRDAKGSIAQKIMHGDKVLYAVKQVEGFMLFAVPANKDSHEVNETVFVEGYLEVEDTFENGFYYSVYSIMSMQ